MTQKFNIKNNKVREDTNAFIKLHTHKTHEQYSQATDGIFCPVLSTSHCNSESQFPQFAHTQ